jgi:DNA-binding transcriptional ArsR family regulator
MPRAVGNDVRAAISAIVRRRSEPGPVDGTVGRLVSTVNPMVEYSQARLDRTLAAIADPTRRQILSRLARGDARVTDLAAPFHMSLNAVSKHLRVLERAGLLRREVRGREHLLSLEARPLRQVAEWVSVYQAFWEQRLDALDDFLRRRPRTTPRRRP